jgi:hypothetical protein
LPGRPTLAGRSESLHGRPTQPEPARPSSRTQLHRPSSSASPPSSLTQPYRPAAPSPTVQPAPTRPSRQKSQNGPNTPLFATPTTPGFIDMQTPQPYLGLSRTGQRAARSRLGVEPDSAARQLRRRHP